MARWLGWIAIATSAVVAIAVIVAGLVVWANMGPTPLSSLPLRDTIIQIFVISADLRPWELWWLELWAIAILAAALLGCLWWLWWRLPQRQVAGLALKIRDPKARADVEDSFRKTIGQALGGAAVLIGAVAAYLQFTQQQQTAKDLLVSNQVAKGFEQFGQSASDKMVLRLGGIYALEGVMNSSEQYHQPVLEALCAFVRDGTIGKPVGAAPAADIQAALTVIGRRKAGPGGVDLIAANIPGADLNRADLAGPSSWGFLIGAGALLGRANLENAHLIAAHLEGADLTRAFLRGAHLEGSLLNGANLEGADLTGTNLTGANLRLARSDGPAQLQAACGQPRWLPPGVPADFTLKPCPPEPAAPAGR